MNQLTKEKSDHIQRLRELEGAICSELDLIDADVDHYFAEGTYTRALHIPKGCVLTGKIHRHSCTNILLKGAIVVVTPEGPKELRAPHVFVSEGMTKKAGYALEDTIFLNIHPWDGPEDPDLIEEEVIVSETEYLEATKWLGQQ